MIVAWQVYGKMSDDNEVFHWQHSYSRVFAPESVYSPADGFMSFEHYNVEIRDRVKCISAAEGCLHYATTTTTTTTSGGLAQLVATLVRSTKLLYAGPG